MRLRLLALAVVLTPVSVFVAAQEPKKPGKDNKTVVVTGCVDGGYLRVHQADAVSSYSDRFRLRGSKQLLKELASKQHRHTVEITGRVIDARGTEHVGHVTEIGRKTKIYTGGTAVPTVPNGDTTSTLEVISYLETAEACKG